MRAERYRAAGVGLLLMLLVAAIPIVLLICTVNALT